MTDTSSLLNIPSPLNQSNMQRRLEPMNEKEEFYENFLNYREISDISIKHYLIKKQRFKEFASYQISISTMDMTYIIEKRYSEFDNLHELILDNHPKVILPEFPKKRYFRNLCKDCLEERKFKLSEFLQYLMENHKEHRIYEFLDFIDLYEKYKNSKENLNLISSLKNCKKHASTKDDYVLLELLIKLNISTENRLQNFQKISDFLFEKKPKISTKIVEILIRGENNLKGLIQILGTSQSENHLVCSIGFKLFCSLFDHEYNKAAEFFLEVYTKVTHEEFSCLHLSDHITEKPAKNCKQYALRLLEYYIDENPNALNNENISLEVNKEYQKYKNKRSMICQKVERLERKNELFTGNQSFETGIKSALIRQDSSFSKLLLINNACEKFSSSN